jgi:hypothetical protein
MLKSPFEFQNAHTLTPVVAVYHSKPWIVDHAQVSGIGKKFLEQAASAAVLNLGLGNEYFCRPQPLKEAKMTLFSTSLRTGAFRNVYTFTPFTR